MLRRENKEIGEHEGGGKKKRIEEKEAEGKHFLGKTKNFYREIFFLIFKKDDEMQ